MSYFGWNSKFGSYAVSNAIRAFKSDGGWVCFESKQTCVYLILSVLYCYESRVILLTLLDVFIAFISSVRFLYSNVVLSSSFLRIQSQLLQWQATIPIVMSLRRMWLRSRYLREFLCTIYRVDMLSAPACRQASLETFAQRLLTPAESIKNEPCWTASRRFLSVVTRSGHSGGAKLQGREVSIMERFFKFARSSQPRASEALRNATWNVSDRCSCTESKQQWESIHHGPTSWGLTKDGADWPSSNDA